MCSARSLTWPIVNWEESELHHKITAWCRLTDKLLQLGQGTVIAILPSSVYDSTKDNWCNIVIAFSCSFCIKFLDKLNFSMNFY